ncbi:MAG: sugar transferase [Gemmatimonadetes bacterium]|nr:sugar transferase [Gemmatimonadota bacterium]
MDPISQTAVTSSSIFGAANAATMGTATPASLRLEMLPPAPSVADFEPRARNESLDRAINFVIAGTALVLISPILLLVALAVKLTSPGPALYTQTRVGRDRRRGKERTPGDRRRSNTGGSLFTIYKFRSMRTDAEAGGQAVWATQNDPRVTPIGAFLRKSRLDELPQLFNVVKGDMNIVGPRPERPQIFVELAEHIPEYHLRALAKPGITGLAQIKHTYDTCMDGVRIKVRYDLEYLRSATIMTDIAIMAKTIPVMVLRKGGW